MQQWVEHVDAACCVPDMPLRRHSEHSIDVPHAAVGKERETRQVFASSVDDGGVVFRTWKRKVNHQR